MKIKTDVVKYRMGKSLFHSSFFPCITPFLPRFVLPICCRRLGKHIRKEDQFEYHYSMSPRKTRYICSRLINQTLKNPYLKAFQISLLDLEKIVRL